MRNPTYEGRDLEAMSFAQNYHNWVVYEFRRFLGRQVGEVGAGSGNFSSLLLNRNIDTLVAIEPSDEMYPLLARKLSTDTRAVCHHAVLADVYKEYSGYFDSMVYMNVLEHIKDDKKELFYINQSLKKGGYVCIFVPALSWLYSDFDAVVGHYRRYCKKQLKELLEKSGFEVVKISYFDIFGVIPWFIFFKIFHKRLNSDNTLLYDRLIVPFSRVLESIFWIPIGKNIIVIAKK